MVEGGSVRYRSRSVGDIERASRAERVRASYHRHLVKLGIALGAIAILLACAAVWLVCGGLAGLICIGAAAACTLYYRRMTDRLFGGVTGDLAGWFIQVTELALIAAVVLGGML